jgi:hypothetical protein
MLLRTSPERSWCLVDLALDQGRGARRIAGIVEQFQVDLVLVARNLNAAQHVVDVETAVM